MTLPLRGPVGTWLLLVAATLLSWAAWFDPRLVPPALAGALAILIAMGKAWLIGMRYMELAGAPWPLRVVYDLWIVIVGATLIVMFALA